MLNKEKYASEIMDIACAGNSIALNSKTKELCPCSSTPCLDCAFSSDADNCMTACETWCNSKYIPSGVRVSFAIEYEFGKIDMTELEHLLIAAGYKVMQSDFEAIPHSEMKKLIEESPEYIEEA